MPRPLRPPPLRVLSQNILQGGEGRLPLLRLRIQACRPDLLALQECLGWSPADLAELGAALGLPHSALGAARPRGSGARYHVGLLSRWPLSQVAVLADPAWQGHALLEARVARPGAPLRMLVTHFDSHNEEARLREVEALRRHLGDLRGEIVLAGDLNAISPHDPYPDDLAQRVLRAGVDKYGHPPRFDVMKALLADGWIDLLAHRPAGSPWVTAPRDRGGVHIDWRTDYILASPALARWPAQAEVVDMSEASDHHGVLAVLG